MGGYQRLFNGILKNTQLLIVIGILFGYGHCWCYRMQLIENGMEDRRGIKMDRFRRELIMFTLPDLGDTVSK